MTLTEALTIADKLKSACLQQGVWVKIEHDFKPDLKMIRMEISIKVEEGK